MRAVAAKEAARSFWTSRTRRPDVWGGDASGGTNRDFHLDVCHARPSVLPAVGSRDSC